MKIIKKILIGIAILIVLLLIAAALLPKTMHVEKSKTINAPVATVFNLVNDFQNQAQWNPWKANDETMKLIFSEQTAGKGARYNWVSENSGEGSQLILESVKNELVKSQIEFKGMGTSVADYKFEDLGNNKTKVTWDFNSETPFPGNLFNIIGKGMVGKAFNQGLDAIAKISEERYGNAIYNGYKITEKDAGERTYLTRRAEVPADNINQFYTQQLPSLYQKLQESGLESAGKSAILYYNNATNKGNIDIASGVQLVNDVVVAAQGVSIVHLDAGEALEVEYQGDYANVLAAHKALSGYMTDKGLLKKYPLIQEFVTDTSKETDPSKWVTKVIYYIAE